MSQTPTVNHNFVLSPAGKGNIISYFFSLDLNKTLVRYPSFLFVRSFFMSLIKLIGLQESLLKCGLFCCNCSTKNISNQYLITGFTFFLFFFTSYPWSVWGFISWESNLPILRLAVLFNILMF